MKEYLQNEIALRINELSRKCWGQKKSVSLVGNHKSFLDVQKKIVGFAKLDKPILITGDSGVGKELFAKSLYLLNKRSEKFISVNCAQYHDQNLMVSELFGHKKGSFTGAMSDRDGIFKECDGGVIFLDEIGELSLTAQAMLLRVLDEGEIRPLGANGIQSIDVRVITATNRDLSKMINSGKFREDLYYRLKYFHLHIPTLRERGDDWKILANFIIKKLNNKYNVNKYISDEANDILKKYHWPGNVRELNSVVETAFHLSNGKEVIQCNDLKMININESTPKKNIREINEYYYQMIKNGNSFWDVVQKKYLEREINRSQVRSIIKHGLQDTNYSYKSLLSIFNIKEDGYQKFMDFLRHHRLKPKEGQLR